MSGNINLGVTIGSLVLLLIIGVVVITGSKANEEAAIEARNNSAIAKLQSEQNNVNIEKQHKALQTFIDNWERRINVSNKINNNTQDKLLYLANISQEQEEQLINLAKNQSLILKKQIANERNIIDNLSSHRIIANLTYKEILDNQATVNHLLNTTKALTGEEYSKLADKRVNNIVGNLSKEHQLIIKGLNLTEPTPENQSGLDAILKLLQEGNYSK